MAGWNDPTEALEALEILEQGVLDSDMSGEEKEEATYRIQRWQYSAARERNQK
jgi:hypothetical protein